MNTQVNEGVLFSTSYEEAINRALSQVSGFRAKPVLQDCSATLFPLYAYKVTLEYDFPNDKRTRTLTTTLYLNSEGEEVKVKGDPSFEVPFSVKYVNQGAPPEPKVIETAKREIPSSAELLSSKIEEMKQLWYPSSFTFLFSVGITTAEVNVNGQTKVNIAPLKRDSVFSLVKSEFNLDDESKIEVKDRGDGYVVTYSDENWNGILELNKVGVIVSKELKITERHAVSIVEKKVNGRALLTKGEFIVYAEDNTTLYKCKVDPHTGDASCERIGIPSAKVKEDAQTFFLNNMLSNPSVINVEFSEEGWNVKGSGETGVMEFIVKHDGSSVKPKFINVNEKFGELWGRKEFPGCEVKSTLMKDSIQVSVSDGNMDHVVVLSLEGKVKERRDSITDSYAVKLAYKTMGQVSGCSEKVVRRDHVIVDLLCNGKHHLVKLSEEGEVKGTLDVVDVSSLIGAQKFNHVISAGYKDKGVVVKVEEDNEFRYILFSPQGEKLKEDTCSKGFLSKVKCVKQELEYRPSTQDPVDIID
ncbi:hypothetical protein [Sulfuracidifex tepidarius]|uniref:Uncharacterized protein n=1 Tax=Sulfuracidifex tepidarius TaxID=1294262 RepID=A0A510E0W8_9CREN|nr:hypothetical protein [Sulfuracidifex tepidarius]BBG25830.1 hypothetical protein IC007_0335 [Sulfuracidifex tepidarius]